MMGFLRRVLHRHEWRVVAFAVAKYRLDSGDSWKDGVIEKRVCVDCPRSHDGSMVSYRLIAPFGSCRLEPGFVEAYVEEDAWIPWEEE